MCSRTRSMGSKIGLSKSKCTQYRFSKGHWVKSQTLSMVLNNRFHKKILNKLKKIFIIEWIKNNRITLKQKKKNKGINYQMINTKQIAVRCPQMMTDSWIKNERDEWFFVFKCIYEYQFNLHQSNLSCNLLILTRLLIYWSINLN